jgi:hypothetical protein
MFHLVPQAVPQATLIIVAAFDAARRLARALFPKEMPGSK